MTGDERDLAREVRDELRLAEASSPEVEMSEPITDWRFDPTDVERYEAGLHSLLAAVEAERD
ncbi:hypothetical protein ABZX92_40420 [Lentzea sp. NPDC006480]|uniref:hypothetical protein n=1 Tax=Lentzea sp. NPDC006480 TaxID=3157176 RepID=UPI0033A48AAB